MEQLGFELTLIRDGSNTGPYTFPQNYRSSGVTILQWVIYLFFIRSPLLPRVSDLSDPDPWLP